VTIAPRLRARARPGRRYASVLSRVLACSGILVFAVLALYGIGWTLFGVAAIVAFVLVEARISRSEWQLDPPAPGASFRFGAGARRGVPLAELAGVVVQHAGGARSRGILITRPYEQWWLVDRHNRVLVGVSAEGFEQREVDAFRAALDVPFAPLAELRLAGDLPEGLPLHARRPGLTVALGVVVAIAVMMPVVAAPPYPW
jgi:hypothetical protein